MRGAAPVLALRRRCDGWKLARRNAMPTTTQSTVSEFSAVAEYLFSLKAHGGKYGIDRMRAFAEVLQHPERSTPCLHIAGTNGKGSVAAMLDAILHAAGWRTGLFTSPHLVHLGERVQVNRERLTDAEVVDYVRELRPMAERIGRADPELSPTFFEYMSAMGFLQFARKRCDVAIIEVGLGGRLDATNIVRPEVSVITSIGLDHCELLGNELTQIAAEKAGIIKPGVPVVVGRMPRTAEKVIRATAAQVGAPIISVAEKYGETVAALPRTNLEGEYQRWNAATATLAAQLLSRRWKIDADVMERGLMHVTWPGRWERIQVGNRRVILDTSHNPEGAETLDHNLQTLVNETGRRPVVITGVLGAARARALVEVICRSAAEVYFVVPDQARACQFDELEALVPATFRGRTFRNDVAALFSGPGQCLAGTADDVIVVTGSIYLIGEVLTRLGASVASAK